MRIVPDTYGLQAEIGGGTWVHILRVGMKVITSARGRLSRAQYKAYTEATEWLVRAAVRACGKPKR